MKSKLTKFDLAMVAQESRLVRFAPGRVLHDTVNQP